MQPLRQNRFARQSVRSRLMLCNARNIHRGSLVRQNREKQTIRRSPRRLNPNKRQLLAHVPRASRTQAKLQGYKQILLTSQSQRIRQHRKKPKGRRSPDAYPGASTASYLEDPSIVEVMLNPDGRLWIDRLSGGLEDTGCRVTPVDAERIVQLVAHHVGVEVHAGSPRVSAELPDSGERFEGLKLPRFGGRLSAWVVRRSWKPPASAARRRSESGTRVRSAAGRGCSSLRRR